MRWIFGYSSLLLSSGISLAGVGAIPPNRVPCALHGWRRNWKANRFASHSDRKRFLDTNSLDVIPSYAYCSIEPDPAGTVNGIAYQVSDGELPALDFREQGYERIDVTSTVTPYPGYSLSGQIEVYVDSMSIEGNFPVNFEYINMGILGARLWDAWVPGFADDYCRSTSIPNATIEAMRFVSIGEDGCTLWLLHERTNQKTCLAHFSFPLIDGSRIAAEETADWQIPCPPNYQAYDVRYHFDDNLPPAHQIPFLADLVNSIWGENPESFLQHPCWLVRMGVMAGVGIKPNWAQALASDEDEWVRRAATHILSSI